QELRDKEHYHVVYKDVALAKAGEGQIWYELACTHDSARVLYILDNCHLAPEEIDDFCFQWNGQPPQYTQCLLISRPKRRAVAAHGEGFDDYFTACLGSHIHIEAKQIYRG